MATNEKTKKDADPKKKPREDEWRYLPTSQGCEFDMVYQIKIGLYDQVKNILREETLPHAYISLSNANQAAKNIHRIHRSRDGVLVILGAIRDLETFTYGGETYSINSDSKRKPQTRSKEDDEEMVCWWVSKLIGSEVQIMYSVEVCSANLHKPSGEGIPGLLWDRK